MGCSAAGPVTCWWAGLQSTQMHQEEGYYLQLLWEHILDQKTSHLLSSLSQQPGKIRQASPEIFITLFIRFHHDKGPGCFCGLILYSYVEFYGCQYKILIFHVYFTVQTAKCEFCPHSRSSNLLWINSHAVTRKPKKGRLPLTFLPSPDMLCAAWSGLSLIVLHLDLALLIACAQELQVTIPQLHCCCRTCWFFLLQFRTIIRPI